MTPERKAELRELADGAPGYPSKLAKRDMLETLDALDEAEARIVKLEATLQEIADIKRGTTAGELAREALVKP